MSCWSPVGSRWEFRTQIDNFSRWCCVPRLLDFLQHIQNLQLLVGACFFRKRICVVKRHVGQFSKQEAPVESLLSRKQGLGVPGHIKVQSNGYSINWYALLVLNRVLYINYIALAIVPSWGEPKGRDGSVDIGTVHLGWDEREVWVPALAGVGLSFLEDLLLVRPYSRHVRDQQQGPNEGSIARGQYDT